MAEISNLDNVSGVALTEEQLRGLIAQLDITMYNILVGNGTYGGAEYEENGEVGFKIRTSEQIKNMMELRKMYNDLLKDPIALGDLEILQSQWDNPDL